MARLPIDAYIRIPSPAALCQAPVAERAWGMQMTEQGDLSWEAQEVLQKIKSFNRSPGTGIPLIQLNMRVGSAKTVKKGIPELKSAGLVADTAAGEPTLTNKGQKALM
jgi:hypothetical protein